MPKKAKRDSYLYELRDSHEIVYYGITRDPNMRVTGHHQNKRFTHMNVIGTALSRKGALERERDEIQRYQKQHGGQPPKYNKNKTY